ncbi:hypothetical protein JTE90_028524 [Oedothorax gibbosus]|uniref:C2H2-type domain-containing protein n=1 Tax=Oedothorax gibbosus TaxID=931172 RepID=A0AAV6VX10_9ARAC|nr:hypothetical protein JTE90_028524 [Oedothorax gibbosus]
MENPAHVFTTGIPMSEKGNFSHNKYGCEGGETLNDVPLELIPDHDYQSNSHINLSDSTSENVEYIHSIQDGFQQSEILQCGFVCDTGDLQSSDLRVETSAMEVECISESDAHIKYPDSPSSFTCKIESFSSIEGFVQGLDEQIDDYLLSDLQKVNKSQSDDGMQSLEEEQRTVTEAISEIAKSFGLEDLLPGNFQDDMKDLPIGDNLCNSENDHIGDMSLGEFDKSLHSSGSSLDLGEQLQSVAQSFELDMLTSPSRSQDLRNMISVKYTNPLKQEDEFFVNVKSELKDVSLMPNNSSATNVSFDSALIKSTSDPNNATYKFEKINTDCITESVCEITEDLEGDIPTVSITDVPSNDLPEPTEHVSTAGTVLVTSNKVSKKMKIVLTLEQCQQIYDIDTESIDDVNERLGLDSLPATLEKEPVSVGEQSLQLPDDEQQLDISEGQDLVELADENPEFEEDQTLADLREQFVYYQDLAEDKSNDYYEDESAFVALVSNLASGSKVRKGKTLICPIEGCGAVLDKECKLRVHLMTHKGPLGDARPFKCDFEGCDWAFTTPYRLRRHAETHLGSKDFVCDIEGCNRKFTTVYNLKTHKKRHKWPNALSCPSKGCNMSFANRRKLELHLRVHNDVEAPYKCGICGKQYYSANCIASHYRTHQYNEEDFKCPFKECGKVYDKICRLRQHVRHHTGDRPYVCPAEGCKWSFMSASKLTRHMRKHTGERKFTCTEPGCGKSFMRPEHLKGHIVIHSGDKPFHCPHESCNAKFTAKSSLYVHVKKHCHSSLKVVYPCPVEGCLKKYNSKATLKQHLNKCHPELDTKDVNIAEKLELTMPVSVVNQGSDNSTEYLELGDDPPPDLKLQLFQSIDDSVQNAGPSFSFTASSGPVKVSAVDTNKKTVPKSSKTKTNSNNLTFTFGGVKSNSKTAKISDKLSKENSSGCARADYCCNNASTSKKTDLGPTFISLNPSMGDTQDAHSFLSNSHISTEIKSPDLMLASNLIFHDQCSEPLMKSNFLQDDCSTSHVLYHDDSILNSGSAFETELIPVSLLSDNVESDESMLNSSGVGFSEQSSIDAFGESMHLHGLD